jgi:hypothetical protein
MVSAWRSERAHARVCIGQRLGDRERSEHPSAHLGSVSRELSRGGFVLRDHRCRGRRADARARSAERRFKRAFWVREGRFRQPPRGRARLGRPRPPICGESSGPPRRPLPCSALGRPLVRVHGGLRAMQALSWPSGVEVVGGRRFDGIRPPRGGSLRLGTRHRDRWGTHREPEAGEPCGSRREAR